MSGSGGEVRWGEAGSWMFAKQGAWSSRRMLRGVLHVVICFGGHWCSGSGKSLHSLVCCKGARTLGAEIIDLPYVRAAFCPTSVHSSAPRELLQIREKPKWSLGNTIQYLVCYFCQANSRGTAPGGRYVKQHWAVVMTVLYCAKSMYRGLCRGASKGQEQSKNRSGSSRH